MRLSVAALFLIVLPFTATAHHSTAEYDRTAVHEIEGEVVAVSWRNPHVSYELRTLGPGGQEEFWQVESGSVSHLTRLGIPRDAIKVGDAIKVAGHTSNRRGEHMFGTNALLSSGTEVVLDINGTPHWTGEYLGGGDWIRDAAEGPISDDRGLFRVWSWDRTQRRYLQIPVSELRLTPEAAAIAAGWDDVADNPVLECTPPGMPATMGNPYPIEFVQSGENFEIQIEEFDLVRTIYLDEDTDRDILPTPLGHSTGHWDGDTLVVETRHINWHFFNRVGVPQGSDVTVHERFTLNKELSQLDYELTVTDAGTFTEPFRWKAHWLWRPGEEIKPYECTLAG